MSQPAAAEFRVLIVEDDIDMITWITTVLAHPAVKTMVASNGIEAVARAREDAISLVILDAVLPGMDGFEVFRTLRADAKMREIKVIFVSAGAPTGAMMLALDLGAYAYFKKPIKPDPFRRKVFQALSLVDDTPAPRPDTARRLLGGAPGSGGAV